MKCLIIGFGVLGQYIVPCCERLMGDGLADNLVAVKATDRCLDELRARHPFQIQAGGIPELLEKMRPELIILAVKPPQVEPVLTGILRPWLDRCRAEGMALPVLYSFASTPRVERYRELLGEDVAAVCMIPSMQREVAGHDTAGIGVSFMAFDPGGPWTDAARNQARDFLGATGSVLELPPGHMRLFIALNCACHVMYEFCFTLSDVLCVRGQDGSPARTAQTLRRALHALFDDPVTGCVPSDGAFDDPAICRTAAALVTAWHDGVMDYARTMGIDPGLAHRHICGSMELFLIEACFGTRISLEENTRRHATPGGFTERAVNAFAGDGQAICTRCVEAGLAGRDVDLCAAELRKSACRCAAQTAGITQ